MNSCTRCSGSGTEPEPVTRNQVIAYLRLTGWAPIDEGSDIGALWFRGPRKIGVWHHMPPGSAELRGVIDRVAAAENRPVPDVERDMRAGPP